MIVDVYDPWVTESGGSNEDVIILDAMPRKGAYEAIVITIRHKVFKNMGIDKIKSFGVEGAIVYDLKYLFPKDHSDLRL